MKITIATIIFLAAALCAFAMMSFAFDMGERSECAQWEANRAALAMSGQTMPLAAWQIEQCSSFGYQY